MLQKIIFILCSAALLCGLYLLACAILAWLYRRGHMSGAKAGEDGSLSVFAEAETLEFAIRCALAASKGGTIPVVVHIRREDPSRGEMIDMTEKLSRTYKNLSYRLI